MAQWNEPGCSATPVWRKISTTARRVHVHEPAVEAQRLESVMDRSASFASSPAGALFGLWLGVLAILLMTISPLALVSFGLNYDEPGGNPLEKIHPATLLAAALVLVAAMNSGNPLTWLIGNAERHPILILYLGAIALLIVHSIRVVNLPFTHFFDTFVLPAMIFLLYKGMSDVRAHRLALLVHALMFVNAAIGIGEFATGLRLTPIVAAGIVIDDDWRSTALLGHPLANASLTGAYLLMLALGGGRDLSWLTRSSAFVVNAGGMIVFGGRAATVLLVALLAALLLQRAYHIVRGARFDTTNILKTLVVAPLAGLGITVLAEQGFFDQFLNRFVDDKGSAETRSEMFELFNHMSWHELLLAPDAQLMESLRFRYGLEFGIESFWVSFVMSYGLLAGIVFFVALIAFSLDIVRMVRPGAIWAFVFFYAVASTSVSLSAKSPLLAVFVFMVLVLMHRNQAQATPADVVSPDAALAPRSPPARRRAPLPEPAHPDLAA